ncbi:MAG TPA: PspC domain-containing protein [Flavobacteriales bacterium]|nr:PspC domain-containing protein [Flavobacteriales bacterium]
MKKTFTANLNGTVFHIEEDAYDQLQRYLANIRAKFSGSAEAEEIMADIEARIAELFLERLQGRQAVSLDDVEHVIQVMGQPEDYVDSDPEPAAEPQTAWGQFRQGRKHKRLFRNPDDRWIGGVLSGVAAYFGHDPLWYRIAFLIILIGGWGSPILVYLVMWALVPEAGTAAEKLEMHGEPVTVDNIKRMFEEGAERFKTGAEKVASEAKDMGRKYKQQGYQAAYQTRSAGLRLLDLFGKVLGIVLLFISVILGLSLISALVGGAAAWSGSSYTGGSGLMGMAGLIFPDAPSSISFTVAAVALCLLPVLLLLLAALWLLFRVRTPRWLGATLTVAFIMALAVATWTGMRLGMDFRGKGAAETSVALPYPAQGTLTINSKAAATRYHYYWGFSNSPQFNSNLIEVDGDSIQFNLARLGVELSPDSSFHLVTRRMARGATAPDAQARAEHIAHSFAWHNDTLSLPAHYTFPKADRIRAQRVKYMVQVPLGGRIRFTPGTRGLLSNWTGPDVDDLQPDLDLTDGTWIMTTGGLVRAGSQPPPAGDHADQGPEAAAGPPIGLPLATVPVPSFPNLVHFLGNLIRP